MVSNEDTSVAAAVLTTPVRERTTAFYTTTIVDENDVGVDLANIATLTLTYYDAETNTIINSRDDQDVLNTNNVTVATTGGTVIWTLQPLDTIIVDDRKELERHIAFFTWTWNVVNIGRKEIAFDIENILTLV